MARFLANQSLLGFQNFINEVYGLPDDRLFSLSDLLSNQERFTMRALKGIRKGDMKKLKLNLLIAFAWLMAIANRLHINTEEAVWRRFPAVCSYCGKGPCSCSKIKSEKRVKIVRVKSLKPKSLSGFQRIFSLIYPVKSRTLADAGVHLAEETGELSEALHVFFGEHKTRQFQEIQNEIADYIACLFGVANSASIDVAKELAKMYKDGCHACHNTPCSCNFSFVAEFSS